jgi:hypothetical protein
MTVAADIATARALFQKAERATDPELKAHALDEALALLASCDPDEITDPERKLIANLRLVHTRQLLAQLVSLASISMDAWFDYIRVLFGELSEEVALLVGNDPQLRENYDNFLRLWGTELAEILERQRTDAEGT